MIAHLDKRFNDDEYGNANDHGEGCSDVGD